MIMKKNNRPTGAGDPARLSRFDKKVPFGLVRRVLAFRKQNPSFTVNDCIREIKEDSDQIRNAWTEAGKYL